MERFVEPSATKFKDKVAFVEKSVELAPELAAKFRIFGTPTFVMLNAKGAEVARFGFQATPQSFESQISRAIGK